MRDETPHALLESQAGLELSTTGLRCDAPASTTFLSLQPEIRNTIYETVSFQEAPMPMAHKDAVRRAQAW
jgi:hypothetical protein